MNGTEKNEAPVTGENACVQETAPNGERTKEGDVGPGAAEPFEPEEAELAAWEEMLSAYPDADAPEKLPAGVIEAVAGGKSPLVAMHEAEIARLRAVIAAYEQKEKAQKSCGSILGTAAPARDPVLEILLGE